MKRFLIVTLAVFTVSLHAMDTHSMDRFKRITLVSSQIRLKGQSMTSAQRKNAYTFHPKAFAHYILTGIVIDEATIDSIISDEQYYDEYKQFTLLIPAGFRISNVFAEYESPQNILSKFRSRVRDGATSSHILDDIAKKSELEREAQSFGFLAHGLLGK